VKRYFSGAGYIGREKIISEKETVAEENETVTNCHWFKWTLKRTAFGESGSPA